MAIETSNEKLAQQFGIWCSCYGRNPFSTRDFVASINGFAIETYDALLSAEQAKAIKQIVWAQRTVQQPFNCPHFRLTQCV